MRVLRILTAGLWVSLLPTTKGLCASINELTTAEGRPYAPTDVSTQPKDDAFRPLTAEDRKSLLGEFRGLVHLGLENTRYEKWSGKSISDCTAAETPPPVRSAGDRWQYRCEVITAEGNGFYYFYPDASGSTTTLQRVEVRLHSGDQTLFKEVHNSLRSLLGAGIPGDARYRWQNSQDKAVLMIDPSEAVLRFVWSRAPLSELQQARNDQ